MQVRIRRLVILNVSQLSRKQSFLGLSGPHFGGRKSRQLYSGLHLEEREGGCLLELSWRAFRMGHSFRRMVSCHRPRAKSRGGSPAALHPAS